MVQENGRTTIGAPDKLFGVSSLAKARIAEIGKEKFDYEHHDIDHVLYDRIKENEYANLQHALDTDDKNVRDERVGVITDRVVEELAEEYPEIGTDIGEIIYKMQKEIVREWLMEGRRVDGRGLDEIRPLASEVDILPRTHGSGLFTRGQTQVLTLATLGPISEEQMLDTIWEEQSKRYLHHYNMPGYSTGEAKALRSPGRREIGHGALAERALVPVLPSVEEFPYAIRVVSEVLSSNGSTSQGSICGSTLALMDAGVPIKAPVAGISCGLIQDDDGSFTTFIDIQGVEDFHGEMDFKVAGTKAGITAIQMDLKNKGLTMEIIEDALERCRKARLEILSEVMVPCIPEPRAEVSEFAPKMISMKIDVDKIREVIGKGGSVIQKIQADCNCDLAVGVELKLCVERRDTVDLLKRNTGLICDYLLNLDRKITVDVLSLLHNYHNVAFVVAIFGDNCFELRFLLGCAFKGKFANFFLHKNFLLLIFGLVSV